MEVIVGMGNGFFRIYEEKRYDFLGGEKKVDLKEGIKFEDSPL
jgi:hypothetical protein